MAMWDPWRGYHRYSEGWDNVIVGCTVENQRRADERLEIFSKLPIKHKNIICQPMISAIDLERYLKAVELVVVGGESDRFARPMHYDWVLSLREQCVRQNVSFEFRQCGTHFIKDGREYILQKKDLCAQARKANINHFYSEMITDTELKRSFALIRTKEVLPWLLRISWEYHHLPILIVKKSGAAKRKLSSFLTRAY